MTSCQGVPRAEPTIEFDYAIGAQHSEGIRLDAVSISDPPFLEDSMEAPISEQDTSFALHTFQVGCRPFQGVALLLENAIAHLDRLSSYADGTPSATYGLLARNTVSDIAIVMAYSLLEGFFHEEFSYYFKSKRIPLSPVGVINKITVRYGISLSNWKSRKKLIDSVRELRNAVVHQNGVVTKSWPRAKSEDLFGEDIFDGGRYPRLSPQAALNLLASFQSIADEYAELMMRRLTMQEDANIKGDSSESRASPIKGYC